MTKLGAIQLNEPSFVICEASSTQLSFHSFFRLPVQEPILANLNFGRKVLGQIFDPRIVFKVSSKN
jgi:hypothetical protein